MSESFAELSPYDSKAKAKASDTISPKTLQSIGYSGEDKKDALDVSILHTIGAHRFFHNSFLNTLLDDRIPS